MPHRHSDVLPIRANPREPVADPTLGIAVTTDRSTAPVHRLVTLGDSLTQGFTSGAVGRTDHCYGALIARELGAPFVRVDYPGFGGLPLNLEELLRVIDRAAGPAVSWTDVLPAMGRALAHLYAAENYWERGEGRALPYARTIPHNLGVYGFDIRDALTITAEHCRRSIAAHPETDSWGFAALPENADERVALRVLGSIEAAVGEGLSLVQTVRRLGGWDVRRPGIETLIVMLGANHALPAVAQFNVVWSDARPVGPRGIPAYKDLHAKQRFTIWRPEHFADEFGELADDIAHTGARHVIFATVPHVTIVPWAKGMSERLQPNSRYFPYYAPAYIEDDDFDPDFHPHIDHEDARAVDSAVDAYNDTIVERVRRARTDGLDWYVFDLGGLLDRLAHRRYAASPAARPAWWQPYELPAPLAALNPPLDSRFFMSSAAGRTQGGLFSLDGIHPTATTYALVAQELIRIMERAGVVFADGSGEARPGPVTINFAEVLARDSLLASPPRAWADTLDWLKWVDALTGLLSYRLRPRWA